jgi:putative FmdB family regulatory protein
MPIYEFCCSQCGTVTEVLARMGDRGEDLVCPECGSKDLSKKVSVTAISSSTGPKQGKTCCGRDERCESPPCGTGKCRK